MTSTQTVTWTVLPNGIKQSAGVTGITVLKMSVFVSPRLGIDGGGNGTLSSSPDFQNWLDWPSKVGTMRFTINFENMANARGVSIDAQPDPDAQASRPDSGLWRSLFKSNTILNSYKYDDYATTPTTVDGRTIPSKFRIKSFSVRKNQEFMREVYKNIALETPLDFPKVSLLTSLRSFGQIASVGRQNFGTEPAIESEADVGKAIIHLFRTKRVLSANDVDITQHGPKGHFVQLKHFHKPRLIHENLPKLRLDPQAIRILEKMVDFHKMITSLSEYPQIMRRLGLIIDLVVPANNVPHSNIDSPFSLKITSPDFNNKVDQQLKTLYLYDGSSFVSAPSTDPNTEPKIDNGMLQFNNINNYHVVQVDIDGASMKAADFVNKLISDAIVDADKADAHKAILDADIAAKIAADADKAAANAANLVTNLASAGNLVDVTNIVDATNLVEKSKVARTAADNANANKAAALSRVRNRPALTTSSSLSQTTIRNLNTNSREACVPPLRSGGISVVKNDRAQDYCKIFTLSQNINQRFEKNISLQETGGSPNDITLNAHDLMRGYKIDIWDSISKKWHSLCKRKGVYKIFDLPNNPHTYLENFSDEGWVQTAVTQTASDDEEEHDAIDLNVHESLFRWQGWSLCAPRPGKPIDPDDKIDPKPVNDPVTQLKLKTSFSAEPNSLPRLRFGREYKVRARVVDLAGNSVEIEKANDRCATPPFKYLRFEPVGSPTPALRNELSLEKRPGESLEHLVIRSFNIDRDHDTLASEESCERHIIPPKTSQIMAEMHGMFDKDGLLNKTAHSRDNGSIIKEGSFEIFPPIDLSNNVSSISGNSHYPIDRNDQAILPYLPDVIADGASLRDLPGVDSFDTLTQGDLLVGETDSEGKLIYKKLTQQGLASGSKLPRSITKIDFGERQNWPNMQPFRLKVVEPEVNEVNKQQPEWDPKTRVLTIKLPKAEVARVRLSSYLGAEDIENMGIWNWVSETEGLAALKQYALHGIHWMITPFREIVLVHAVQQPIGKPNIESLKPQTVNNPNFTREAGSTHVHLAGKIIVHRKSTMKIDMLAEWGERVDDGKSKTNPEEFMIIKRSRAFDMYIALDGDGDGDEDAIDIEGDHYLGDTKHRMIRYRAVATTRFKEYFPQSQNKKINITRESEQFSPLGLTPSEGIDIPSSARPLAPKILYAIPTFEWKTEFIPPNQPNWHTRIGSRLGGGLRVYMERPWYSSGDGELLGIVIPQEPIPRDSDRLERIKPYVTLWGRDPIWKSESPVFASPALSDFKNVDPQNIKTDVVIKEMESVRSEGGQQKVTVIGHPVHFNAERGLWYCDIVINPGKSYYPFLRLALVRFQPHSIAGAHFSPVVLADYVQLAPDRSLEITKDNAVAQELTIKVSGITYQSRMNPCATFNAQTNEYIENLVSGGSEIEISVEKLDPRIGAELGWDQIGVPISISPSVNPQGVSQWSGTVTLPDSQTEKGSLRVVIKEFEKFISDSQDYRFINDSQSYKIIDSERHIKEVNRLVYSDAVPV